MIQLNFKKLHPDAIIPTKNYSTDAGIDFYALEDSMLMHHRNILIVRTGIAWEPRFNLRQNNYVDDFYQRNFNIYMKIEDRSNIASKTFVHVKARVIDQTYRGEIQIVLQCCDNQSLFEVNKGQEIAQGIVYAVPKTTIQEVNQLQK